MVTFESMTINSPPWLADAVVAVAGRTLVVGCPVAGWPVEKVEWTIGEYIYIYFSQFDLYIFFFIIYILYFIIYIFFFSIYIYYMQGVFFSTRIDSNTITNLF